MFRNLLRIFAVILIFAFIKYLIYAVRKAFTSAPSTGKPSGTAAGSLLRDPVCGTFVSKETAIEASARGVTHYFCSAACRDKFLSA